MGTTPSLITNLSDVPNSTDNSNYASRGDSVLNSLNTVISGINSYATTVYNNVNDADTSSAAVHKINIGGRTSEWSSTTSLTAINQVTKSVVVGSSFYYGIVPNTTTSSLKAYSLNTTTPSITLVANYNIANPVDILLSPNNEFLIVVTSTGTLQPYSINQSTGALTARTAQTVSTYKKGVISPNGTRLYVLTPTILYYYSINSTHNLGGSNDTQTNLVDIKDIALSPDSNYLYVLHDPSQGGNTNSGRLNSYTTANHTLIASVGIINATSSTSKERIFLSSSGKYLYAVDRVNTIHAFLVNTTNGTPEAKSTTTTESTATFQNLVIASNEKYLVCFLNGNENVRIYYIQTDGSLSAGNFGDDPGGTYPSSNVLISKDSNFIIQRAIGPGSYVVLNNITMSISSLNFSIDGILDIAITEDGKLIICSRSIAYGSTHIKFNGYATTVNLETNTVNTKTSNSVSTIKPGDFCIIQSFVNIRYFFLYGKVISYNTSTRELVLDIISSNLEDNDSINLVTPLEAANYYSAAPPPSNNNIIRYTAPATSTSTGVKGDLAIDENWVYVCVNTNSWKRFALEAH